MIKIDDEEYEPKELVQYCKRFKTRQDWLERAPKVYEAVMEYSFKKDSPVPDLFSKCCAHMSDKLGSLTL